MVEKGREILVALPEVHVIGAEVPLEDALRIAAGDLGLVHAVERVEEDTEVPEVGGGVDVLGAEDAPVRLVHLALELLRVLQPPFPEQDLGVVALHPRRVEVGRIPAGFEHRERLPELALGLVEPALVHPHGSESGEAHRHARAIAGKPRAPERERLIGERRRRLEEADPQVDPRDRVEEVGLDGRLGGELGPEQPRALLEDLPRRDVLPAGLLGIGDLEEADEELLDARGTQRLRRRVARVRLGAARLPRRAREARHEREEDERGGCGAGPVPSKELPRAVEERVRPRADRLAGQVPPQVLPERRGREVPPLRLAAQGIHDDVVEVALQAARRAGSLRIAGEDAARAHARPLEHLPLDLGLEPSGRRDPSRERERPGQELVEDDAQRPDVRRRRRRLPEDELGRRVGRGESAGVAARHGRVRVLALEELRDPEVEELHVAVLRHEDVRRLEVPVDDEAPVRGLDGVAAHDGEADARVEREVPGFRENRDRLPVHELEREVRPPVPGAPAVEETRDVRVGEAGEDLTLAPEPREDLVGVHAALDELERDDLLELAVRALREEDFAHAAAPEEAQRPVGADAFADRRPGLLVLRSSRPRRAQSAEAPGRALVQEALRRRVGFEEGADGGAKLRVPLFERLQAEAALGVRQVDEVGEDVPRLAEPAGRRHRDPSGPASSRWRNARAARQCLFTVRSEISSAVAISSTDSPPKNRHSTRRASSGSSSCSRERARSTARISSAGSSIETACSGSRETGDARPPRFTRVLSRA